MRDIQQDDFVYDIFGSEVYEGDMYFFGDEGMMKAPPDNYDANDPIVELLVRNLGISYILEQLGYDKRYLTYEHP